MLTRPSNDPITSPNLTHRKPFFSRKVGLADLFKVSHSAQPTSDDTSLTVDASSLVQSVRSVSHSVGGSTWIELHSLPTGRLRRPDTETGQRAPMTVHSDLTWIPSRYPGPENGIQLAKALIPWRSLTLWVACNTILQTLFAIALGGVGGLLPSFNGVIIVLGVVIAIISTVFDIIQAVAESRLPYRG